MTFFSRLSGLVNGPIRKVPAGVRFSSHHASSNELSYTRLSAFWLASGGMSPSQGEDAHGKLVRAGFLRQSHAGIFHVLPLGLRVQSKLEGLIDQRMLQLGASKVSLSSVSSQALWERTGRLEGYGPELFRFSDRKEVPYLLAPTHEEEVTSMVAGAVSSYKSLPLRLYQIGRKYRDEMRPRHGVLRSREFLMKDLYTFDYSVQASLETYEEVRSVYKQLFDELKLPYVVAEASSGDIGGDLSHEFHLPTPAGEDNIVNCVDCGYAANDEVASSRVSSGEIMSHATSELASSARVWRAVTRNKEVLINVWYPAATGVVGGSEPQLYSDVDVSPHAVKSVVPDLDSGLEDSLPFWKDTRKRLDGPAKIVNVVDMRLGSSFVSYLETNPTRLLPCESDVDLTQAHCDYITASRDGTLLNTLRLRDGDECPRCDGGKLNVRKAIELGHTFHLGTRYSEPLSARIQLPASLAGPREIAGPESSRADATVSLPMQMGCHGIGLSRIIGAVAHHLADKEGLNWPRAIAPFEAIIIPRRDAEADALALSRTLGGMQTGSPSQDFGPIDVALDDRAVSLSWKLKDADLIGYPVVIVFGRRWESDRVLEVKCRRLGVRSDVPLGRVPALVDSLLAQI